MQAHCTLLGYLSYHDPFIYNYSLKRKVSTIGYSGVSNLGIQRDNIGGFKPHNKGSEI
jgi:hypothetical protein